MNMESKTRSRNEKTILTILEITVGIILILFLALFVLLALFPQKFMGYDPDDDFEEQKREEIVQRINNYIKLNGKHPESLSELGFEQLPVIYKYCDNSIYLNRCAHLDFVLECWDADGKLWQYVSEDKKWYDYAYCEFEPPINIDTIRGINKVYYAPRGNMQFVFDSLRINDNIVSIMDCDIEEKPDSLAYAKCYTADTLKMEGWVGYFAHNLPGYQKEFGEWKYYDGQGNCYRKFWNYKANGKLIYEADR